MFITHINYFLSNNSVTSYGLPLTAYKVGDRARFGYSNPTEWGYLLQAYIVSTERNITTRSTAIKKINTSLNTMLALQQDPNQNYKKLFYPYYKVTNSAGNDIFPYHDANVWIPSIDNGLLYMSLLIVEGWAKEIGNMELENKSRTIKNKMNYSIFIFTQGPNKYLAHTINANTNQLSPSKWDVYADEGGLMTLIAYFSNSINFSEYQELTNSQLRSPATWNSYTVKEAAWFNAMFTWGVRSLAGFRVIGTDYSKDSFVQTTKAHLAYGDFISIDHPGFSDAMSQVGGTGRYTPPNLANQVPLSPPLHITPHAFFIPLNIVPDLDNETIKNLTHYISLLKNDSAHYYHNSGSYPYGFEVIASPYMNDTSYSGSADGRNNFETLSEAYTALSLFNALQYTNNSKDFYDIALNVPGYQTKVNNTLNFLYPIPTCIDNDNDGFNISGGGCGPIDCNDTSSSIYPGAIENCNNSVDDDCDGFIDLNDNYCVSCITPTDGIVLMQNTTLCLGNYNLSSGIRMGVDNIALDCNYSTLNGIGVGYGINITSRRNIIIKNCVIKNYHIGIGLVYSSNNSIISNNISHSSISGNDHHGLYLDISNNNVIKFNNIYSNKGYGAYMRFSSNNTLIMNKFYSNDWYGLYLVASSNNSIIGNMVYSNDWDGIHLSSSSANTINRNDIYLNNNGGIHLWISKSNLIINNTIDSNGNNGYGIYISVWSDNNSVFNNNISNNKYGIYILSASNNTLLVNTMVNNTYNFIVNGDSILDFINYIDTSNTVNGKPIYYWINRKNKQIPADAGYVGIVNSTNITVKDLILTNNGQGILVVFTNNSVIENINVSNNYYGIYLFYSNSNIIKLINLSNNEYGIDLLHSDNNTLTSIKAANNFNGVGLSSAQNNNIFSNRMCDNTNYDIVGYPNNTGTNNSCDFSYGWNDTGAIGCTYHCYECIDNDNDGFNVTGTYYCGPKDCNDSVSSTFPGAIENCSNNADDDCDGRIDANDYDCMFGCVTPYDGINITRDAIFCTKRYTIHNIYVGRDNITINCNDSSFQGSYTGTLFNIVSRSNITLRNCSIYEYRDGIMLRNSSNSLISDINCWLRSNYCIRITQNSSKNRIVNNVMRRSWDSGLTIEDSSENIISENYLEGNSYQNGIYLWNSHRNLIQNNNILNNGHAPVPWAHAGGIALLYSSSYNNITNNTIQGNIKGIYSYSGSYGLPSIGNIIEDNEINSNTGGGIFVYRGSEYQIENNNITANNGSGIGFMGYNDSGKIQFNNIFGNLRYDIYSDGKENIKIEKNWWGTINCSEINRNIYDKRDNPSKGLIDFLPILNSPYPNGTPIYCTHYNLSLRIGWNLVSIPIEPGDRWIKSLFNSTNFSAIYSFNNTQWLFYVNETHNNFQEINENMGFWINSLENQTIPINGMKFDSLNNSLKKGWNLIGYPRLDEINVSTIFADLNITVVFAYNGSWSSYVPNRTLNSLTKMKSGYGYWIKTNENATVIIP